MENEPESEILIKKLPTRVKENKTKESLQL